MSTVNRTNYKIILLSAIIILIVLIALVSLILLSSTKNINKNEDTSDVSYKVNGNFIDIDVKHCQNLPYKRIYYYHGSTSLKISGIDNNNCVFYFGSEIEDPYYNGETPYRCDVPSTLIKFTIPKLAINNLSESLSKYCRNINSK